MARSAKYGVLILLAGCQRAPTAPAPEPPPAAGTPSRVATLAPDVGPEPRIVRSASAILEDFEALEGDPIPQALAEELDALRYNARLDATGEDPAETRDMDGRVASAGLQARARAATNIDDLVHPDRGLFILSYYSGGIRLISLDHRDRWVPITTEGFGAEIDGQALLEALRSASSLPNEETYTEGDCRFHLDAVVPTTSSVIDTWAEMTDLSADDPVEDGYALRPWPQMRDSLQDDEGIGMDRQTFEAMQRSAHAVTHTMFWDTQKFDFGRVEGTWYLLGVEILVDVNEAC